MLLLWLGVPVIAFLVLLRVRIPGQAFWGATYLWAAGGPYLDYQQDIRPGSPKVQSLPTKSSRTRARSCIFAHVTCPISSQARPTNRPA